jgi:hypothetical protein
MNIEELEVFIAPDGQVGYEVRGVKGRRCLDVTKELDNDLGGQVLSRQDTWEMHEAAPEQVEAHRAEMNKCSGQG